MPQMSPMQWDMLYMYTTVLILCSLTVFFFYFFNKNFEVEFIEKEKNNRMNWLW